MNKLNKIKDKKEISKIIKLYKKGIPSTKIGVLFKVSRTTIIRVLKRNNVEIRNKSEASRQFRFNENAFATITPESAYWIGFLMADGCIASENTLQIELREKDKNHLKKLKTFLKSEHRILQPPCAKKRGACRFTVRSDKLIKDLMKYGIVRKKSLTCKVIGLENNRDFWRGVMDGDGNIWYNPTQGFWYLKLLGSKPLMQQYLNFIKTITPTKVNLYPHKNIWTVHLGAHHAASVMYALYNNSCVALDRKLKIPSKLFS